MSADRLLKLALSRSVTSGTLRVITASGARLAFGDGKGSPVEIRIHDRAAQLALLRDPDMQLGELYMSQRLTMEQGTIYDFLILTLSNQRQNRPSALARILDRFRFATRRLRQRNVGVRSQRNVAHHYDLSRELYELFLDKDMQYSCAYFENASQTLDDAQLAKKRHITAKLCVEPDHRILDVGCGWGGLGRYLASTAGAASVHGITLSEEQISVARQRTEEAGLSDKLSFSLQDYRTVNGVFDRIVSVGMFEHVGISYYDTFFKSCHRLLEPDGVMLLHTIGCSDVPGFVTPWLNKYIFPGGYIPSLSEIIPAIERAGMIVSDVEILQLHYAWTLRAWRERFLAKRGDALRLYDERFCLMWEFYLAAAEAAFRCEDLNVFQIQITKSPAMTPATRNYIALREAELRAREELKTSAQRCHSISGSSPSHAEQRFS